MTSHNDNIIEEDLNENVWKDVKARFHKMAKKGRFICFAISVSLILAITDMIPVIFLALDEHDVDDVRGNSFELFRDQQEGIGQIQSQYLRCTNTNDFFVFKRGGRRRRDKLSRARPNGII
jgi:hypothetical protein